MVVVVYVLMVPQGLLIITLIIIIHVATRKRCVHAYVPPVTVKNVVNKIVISHDGHHSTSHKTGPGQSLMRIAYFTPYRFHKGSTQNMEGK